MDEGQVAILKWYWGFDDVTLTVILRDKTMDFESIYISNDKKKISIL